MRLLTLVIVFAVVGCITAGHYHNEYFFNPEDYYDGLAVIETKAILVKDGEEKTEEYKATSILLDNGLILALTHCTEIPTEEEIMTPFGFVSFAYDEKKDERYFVNGQEVELIGRKNDISLFKGNHTKGIDIPFGDSDKLRIGDKIAIIGYSFTKMFNFKKGIVSILKIGEEYGKFKDDVLMIDASVNPGDSGSPLIAFRGHKPVIVGVVNAGIRNSGIGFAIKINYIKSLISEITS
jgi:V8-like Glu-specific endopeptidase